MSENEIVSIDEFKKLEIRLGEIVAAEKVPDTDKLLKLSVSFGKETPRQIISGISAAFPDPGLLVGTQCFFAANLAPRVIRGLESQGMILAIGEPGVAFSLLQPSQKMPLGSRVK
jgi:methionyl-tRNA synthetase